MLTVLLKCNLLRQGSVGTTDYCIIKAIATSHHQEYWALLPCYYDKPSSRVPSIAFEHSCHTISAKCRSTTTTKCNSATMIAECRTKLLQCRVQSMAMMRGAWAFCAGGVYGVYIAQNYNVPDVGKLFRTAMLIARIYEENYRKKPPREDD
ncbi:hypothetical protein L7F22_030462 [Adiantum nelumboides]|nr:hypothetical protein [Adiantum nelumboides]